MHANEQKNVNRPQKSACDEKRDKNFFNPYSI